MAVPQAFVVRNCVQTEMGYEVGPRLRESRLLAPSGCQRQFTQPRAPLMAQFCTVMRFGSAPPFGVFEE